jgi:uncharacterized protein (TIGR02452 family)
LYSDRIIYSPDCPVLKNDAGILFGRPYSVDFITSPAPNAGAIEKNQPQDMNKIKETLQNLKNIFLGKSSNANS